MSGAAPAWGCRGLGTMFSLTPSATTTNVPHRSKNRLPCDPSSWKEGITYGNQTPFGIRFNPIFYLIDAILQPFPECYLSAVRKQNEGIVTMERGAV
ncbi:MAG: hypothetical protein SWH78_08470 [Thermodesulfobacteriota bacterium]|nr:hypothetical protein [Thermodesulfobacteriota bacterium]